MLTSLLIAQSLHIEYKVNCLQEVRSFDISSSLEVTVWIMYVVIGSTEDDECVLHERYQVQLKMSFKSTSSVHDFHRRD